MGMSSRGLKRAWDRFIDPVRALGRWIAKGQEKAPLCNT